MLPDHYNAQLALQVFLVLFLQPNPRYALKDFTQLPGQLPALSVQRVKNVQKDLVLLESLAAQFALQVSIQWQAQHSVLIALQVSSARLVRLLHVQLALTVSLDQNKGVSLAQQGTNARTLIKLQSFVLHGITHFKALLLALYVKLVQSAVIHLQKLVALLVLFAQQEVCQKYHALMDLHVRALQQHRFHAQMGSIEILLLVVLVVHQASLAKIECQ